MSAFLSIVLNVVAAIDEKTRELHRKQYCAAGYCATEPSPAEMLYAYLYGKPPPPPPVAPARPYRGPPLSSAYIFTFIAVALVILYRLQTKSSKRKTTGRFLPPPNTEKREYEVWVLKYSIVWMGTFAIVIAFQLYELFDASGYFLLCGGLALPLLLQPLVYRTKRGKQQTSIGAQHAARAQVWVAVFGFIGNYWYTHYFYCVLRAKYTMPAWRLNDVPIAMFSATHFYFTSYHVLANLPLRHVRTSYQSGLLRDLLEWSLVLAMSYTTAFMETLTISNFPYYDFEDRNMAYTVGSAFYALYFVVSFPVYLRLDEEPTSTWTPSAWSNIAPLRDAAASALASGMLVLMFLDLTRLAVVGTPLKIGGKLMEITG